MDYNEDEFISLLILFALSHKEKANWDQYRNKAVKLSHCVEKKLKTYFEDIFKDNILQYSLPIKTPLYRARQIKSYDWDQVEVDIKDIEKEVYKILLTDDDLKSLEDPNSFLTPEILFAFKFFANKGWDDDKWNKIQKKYSNPNLFYGFSKSGSGVPPRKNRKNGRLNTKKDAYLYLALDKDTAIYEMRPSISGPYSIAMCETNRELTLVDLRAPQEIKSTNDFMVYSLADKVSEPNTDNDDNFYHITQCLSHFLQSKDYDGIIYTSSLKKGGVNVMLFEENNVTFTSSEIITIDNITIDYTTNLPFSE